MLNAHGEGTGRSSSEDVITELMRRIAMASGLDQVELESQPDPVALVEMPSSVCEARVAIWRGEPIEIVLQLIGAIMREDWLSQEKHWVSLLSDTIIHRKCQMLDYYTVIGNDVIRTRTLASCLEM
jgi:hypothetical protein